MRTLLKNARIYDGTGRDGFEHTGTVPMSLSQPPKERKADE